MVRTLGVALLTAFVLVWAFGYWGIVTSEWSGPSRGTFLGPVLDRAYAALQLFVLQPPQDISAVSWQLHFARFFAPFITYSSIVVAVWWLLRDRINLLRASVKCRHVIVCGVGSKGLRLIRALCSAGYDVVAVDRDEPHPQSETIRGSGAILLHGDARDPETLLRAGVRGASFIMAVTGDDDVNLEIALQARERRSATPRSGEELRCVAHVRNPRLCRLMKEYEVLQDGDSLVRLDFFDLYSTAAQAVLRAHPIPGPTSGRNGRPPHVVLVGLGPLGRSLLASVVRTWHVASEAGGMPDAPPVRLTIYGIGAERKFANLCAALPDLEACSSAEVRDIDAEIPAFLGDELTRSGTPDVAYVCMDEDASSLTAALSLHRSTRRLPFPIVACMMEDTGVARLLALSAGETSSSREFRNLHGFAVLEKACTVDVLFGPLARQVHENWRRRALAAGEKPGSKASLVPWEELDHRWREDNRRQAEDMVEKLRAIDCAIIPEDDWTAPRFLFSESEVNDLAKMEHDRWMKAKLGDGYRRGPRDDRQKLHPDILPWEALDGSSRDKDRDAVRQIPDLLATLGLTIHRLSEPTDPGDRT